MPCGCQDVCNCFLEDTDTISVTGSGTALDPYLMTVIPDPEGGLFNTADGVSILLDPDPDNQASLSAAGLFVPCCSACVSDSDTIDFDLDIDGCVTGDVKLDPDGGLVSNAPDGIGILLDPSSTAPVSVGPLGLRVDCCGEIEAPCPVDVQVFEVDGEWVQPAGAEWVEVLLIGAGGGGGSGCCGAAGTNRSSGGGGWAGGMTLKKFRASDLPATVDVYVGTGGVGAAAVGPGAANGLPGTNGGGTAFGGSGPTHLPAGDEFAFAGGGGDGNAGSTAGNVSVDAAASAYYTTETSNDTATAKANTTSAPNARSVGQPTEIDAALGGTHGLCPGSGSSGAGLNAANAEAAGRNGKQGDFAGENNVGGTAGAVGGGDAGNGTDSTTLAGGGGGGGGGSSNVDTVDGGDGGNGGLYGAGGGGGGSATSGGTAVSGAGGDGANGIAIVVTHLCAEAGGASGGGVPLGTGVDFWGEEADVPVGWVLAYGQLLDATTYTDWLALVGTTYGGDGVTTVGVPDKRDRVSVGKGDMGGVDAGLISILANTLGATAGAAALTTAQLPPHSHGVNDPGHRHSPSTNNAFATGPTSSAPESGSGEFQGQQSTSFTSTNATGISIQNAGSGQEHLQPSIACNYIIKVLP